MELDFNNLPSRQDAEKIIQEFNSEETLAHINAARLRVTQEGFEPDENEVAIFMMLTRRLRALRETKSKVGGKTKTKAAPASLDQILGDL